MQVFCAYEGWDMEVDPPDFPSGEFVGPGASHTTLAKARILIVDDDKDMRALAKRVLERDDHMVFEVSNGADALRFVKAQPLDLLILDLVMPNMGGLDVLKTLRESPDTAKLPVLILTSMEGEASTRTVFDLGATDYLTKPYSMPQLSARVRSVLARFMIL